MRQWDRDAIRRLKATNRAAADSKHNPGDLGGKPALIPNQNERITLNTKLELTLKNITIYNDK